MTPKWWGKPIPLPRLRQGRGATKDVTIEMLEVSMLWVVALSDSPSFLISPINMRNLKRQTIAAVEYSWSRHWTIES
jgi:hypothetical protein